MRNGVGVFDPEQLRALQSIFNKTWLRATGGGLAAVADWGPLRDDIAERVMNNAQSDLTTDKIARTVLAGLNCEA